MNATTRSSKEERRREIIEAATREFAIGGLHGTPVDAIAKQVGVSQPYLFQLFGTKKDLFIATVHRTFERTVAVFRTAAAEAGEDASQADILMAMGVAYGNLLDDRSLLRMQMQAYAACGDEEIRDVVRDEMLRLVSFVQSASGAPEAAIREWLAYGMLMNVVAVMDLTQGRRGLGAHHVSGLRCGVGGVRGRRGRQDGAHGSEGAGQVDAGRAAGSWPDPPHFRSR